MAKYYLCPICGQRTFSLTAKAKAKYYGAQLTCTNCKGLVVVPYSFKEKLLVALLCATVMLIALVLAGWIIFDGHSFHLLWLPLVGAVCVEFWLVHRSPLKGAITERK